MAVLNIEAEGMRLSEPEFAVLAAHAGGRTDRLRSLADDGAVADETGTGTADHATLERAEIALRETGLLSDDGVAPLARHLLAIFTEPLIELHIETFVVSGLRHHRVAIHPDGAVVSGPTDDGEIELVAVPLRDLVPRLLRYLRLGPRRPPAWTTPISVPASVLPEVATAPAVTFGDGVGALVGAGMTEDEAETVAYVLLERRLSFRATSLWAPGPGESASRTVTVVDGGKMGVWFSEPDLSSGTTTLTPTTVPAVGDALVGLIPRRLEPS
ncbi:MAG: ESX secretion-associated protein EspG [Acidimicrobiales bacterium]